MKNLPHTFFCSKSRSQALVEFALFGSLFLATLGGLLDFGLMMSRQQAFTNAAREGANFAAKSQTDNVALGVEAALLSCTSSVSSNTFYQNGGILVTKLERVSAGSTVLTNDGWAAFGFNGGTSNAIMQSKVVLSGVTNNPFTLRPALVTNVTVGKYLYVCEIFYSNKSRMISYGLPEQLYDKAFFVSP